jgi:sugar phosphate isomerase/epimerase
VKAAHDAGVEISFLTTNITDANAEAEQLLAVAGEHGIRRIKLGYYRYEKFGTLKKQINQIRAQIGGVAKLAAKHNVLPCVHIHSGDTIPSHGTQLYELIRDFRPDEVGAYVDPMHMSLEGGGDGWRQGLDLVAPWVALCSLKNFAWEPAPRDSKGQAKWRVRKVPLADGFAPLPEFIAALKSINFAGIYSLHSEYKGGGSFRDLSTDECLTQTAADLKYFRTLL